MHQPKPIPLHLQAAGRQIGAFRWIEKQLFHILGSWSTKVSEPTVKVMLDEQSFEFAWHAELWADRLPEHRGLTPQGLTAPASTAIAAFFRELVDLTDKTSSIEKLAIIYRVVIPRLVTTYSSYLGQDAGTDATQRALRLVLADEQIAWKAGERQIQALLIDEAIVDLAIERQRWAEKALVRCGGLTRLDG
jgi:hypothetical protein